MHGYFFADNLCQLFVHTNVPSTGSPQLVLSVSTTTLSESNPKPFWLSVEGEWLAFEDKQILQSNEWLNDKIVNATQKLLRKQSHLSGFMPTYFEQKMSAYKHIDGSTPLIQVILVGQSHWVTVSNVNCDADTITIYDSLYPTISKQTCQHICHFWKSKGKEATFKLANVQRQPNGSDCGVFALAFATELAHGCNPVFCRYSVPKMREHLLTCLESGKMQPFPQTKRRIPHTSLFKSVQKELLFCFCRLPNDKSKAMICCDVCQQWYHASCVGLNPEELAVLDKWFCEQPSCNK